MLGIVLALVAALIIGLGLSYQRIGLKNTKFGLKLLRSKQWLFGSALATLAFLVYYLALTVEKLVIVQPLINTSIVFTVIFGYVLTWFQALINPPPVLPQRLPKRADVP